jgi:hypothetical protein
MPHAFIRVAGTFATTALLAAGLAACGDDDDGGDGGGSYEEYVAAVCDATRKYEDDVDEAAAENPDASEDEAVDIILPIFAEYLDGIRAANPPDEVKPYHDANVERIQEGYDALEEQRTLDALDSVAEPETPPQEIADRLNELAVADEDCVAADFTFGT